MKCLTCGNEIPDNSVQCPFCGASVQAQPVQPQMAVNTPVVEAPAQPVQAAPIAQAPVQEQPVATVVEQPVAPVQAAPVSEPVSAPTTPMYQAEPAPIIDGGKIASTAPVGEPKKKKKGLLIAVIIFVLLLICGGLGAFYYYFEYQTADKRIEAIANKLLSFTTEIKNDNIELSSGNYAVNLNVTADDQNAKLGVKGKYGVDLNNKIMDFTIDLDELNLTNTDLINESLNTEFFINENKLYVLLENFTNTYYYDEVEGLQSIFDTVEQNNIDYRLLANEVKNALVTGIKATEFTQTVEKAAVNGKSAKYNVLKMQMTRTNEEKFIKATIKYLENDNKFLEEIAKTSDKTVDELKVSLQDAYNEVDVEGDPDTVITIYSEVFGVDFEGMTIKTKIEDDTYMVEINPLDNGYGFNISKNQASVAKFTYEKTEKKTSTLITETYDASATIYVKETAYKAEIGVSIEKDVNPKVDKINTKNSKAKSNISDEELENIINKSGEFGTLGLYLPKVIETYFRGVQIPTYNGPDIIYDEEDFGLISGDEEESPYADEIIDTENCEMIETENGEWDTIC